MKQIPCTQPLQNQQQTRLSESYFKLLLFIYLYIYLKCKKKKTNTRILISLKNILTPTNKKDGVLYKIVKGKKPLTITTKYSILDVGGIPYN